jgi:hypothetical protein
MTYTKSFVIFFNKHNQSQSVNRFCSVAVITPDSDHLSGAFRQPRFDSGQDLILFALVGKGCKQEIGYQKFGKLLFLFFPILTADQSHTTFCVV